MANTRQVPISVLASQVPSDQTGVSLLLTRVNLPDEMCDPSSPNAAKTDGGDLRFYTTNSQAGRMNVEVVSFEHDSASGAGDAQVEVWIQAPFFIVSSLTDTPVYCEYGDGALSQPAVGGLYGRNDVWANEYIVSHDTISDSTGNTTSTIVGTINPVEGVFGNPIGGGRSTAGAQVLFNFTPLSNVWTMRAWSTLLSANARVVCLGNSSSAGDQYNLGTNNSRELNYVRSAGNSPMASAMPSTGWQFLAARESQSLPLLVWSNNGVNQDSAPYDASSITPDRASIFRSADSTPFGNAIIASEVKISKIDLSDNYILTEYNNQSSPSTFWLTGTPIPIGGGGDSSFIRTKTIKSNIVTSIVNEVKL